MSVPAGAVGMCLVLTACSGSAGQPAGMPQIIGYRNADRSLITVSSCIDTYLTVTETSSRVTVTLYETQRAPATACRTGLWSIHLRAALGARPVYDGFTGKALFVDSLAYVAWFRTTPEPAPTRPPDH